MKKEKIKKTPKNDKNYQISRTFGISRYILEKRFSVKYEKVFIIRKAILSACHYLSLYISEVIALLVTAYIIHQPPLAKVFNQI